MDEREKKNLRRQLQMQADSVVHMDDKQLALSVADSMQCSFEKCFHFDIHRLV